MHVFVPAITTALLLLSTLPAQAADASPACAAKRANIESQISEARARGRTQQGKGLERALKAHQANCSDASLAREREDRIAKAQREVAQREADLREAQGKGDKRKIATRQSKLDKAQRDLAEAQRPLQQ